MSNHGTALTDGQLAEFLSAGVKALTLLAPRLGPELAENWSRNTGAMQRLFLAVLLPPARIIPSINWELVYEKLDMRSAFITYLAERATSKDLDDEKTWAIPVLRGVTCSKVVGALRDLGIKVKCYVRDLDCDILTNDRDPNDGSYVVRFNKTIEADPENANQSAKARKRKGVEDITILERLLLGLGYFLMIGQHLDVKEATLCAGSRDSDGDVPYVYWSQSSGEMCIRWWGVTTQNSRVRARAVVP